MATGVIATLIGAWSWVSIHGSTAIGWADSLSSVITAAVALIAYGRYLAAKRHRRLKLEEYLANERAGGRFHSDEGKRSIPHLMAALRMTEAEIFEAAFENDQVNIHTTVNGRGHAEDLMFSNTSITGGVVGK